jgi:hypothetical protein
MELKLNGTIKHVGEIQEFDSGFKKLEFVITTDETYPQDVKFEVVKEKAETFAQYNKVGAKVDVKFNVRGNEYNGKYYVNLQAWHVSTTSQDVKTEAPQVEEESDLPF